MAGIYIHIPFCKQACNYCDFHFSTSMKLKERFVTALIHEISLRKNELEHQVFSSIYFGGGTPSLLSKEELNKILNTIYSCFDISETAEITLEANPDDLTERKLNELKQTVVNRLSIGVQSFREEDLEYMNRAHTAQEAIDCIRLAKTYGFKNITIDLIYGIPNMSNDAWRKNLNLAIALDIPHVSSYALTVEKGTALHYQISKKKAQPVNEYQSAEQFEILMEVMHNSNYEQYEISNFCRENYYSRHNSSYWQDKKYMGFGPSAHSYNGMKRFWNVSNNSRYIKSLQEDILPMEEEPLSVFDKFNEYIMTSLRTSWGCNIAYVENIFSTEFVEHLRMNTLPYIHSGYIEKSHNTYKLTSKGKLIADKISAELFMID